MERKSGESGDSLTFILCSVGLVLRIFFCIVERNYFQFTSLPLMVTQFNLEFCENLFQISHVSSGGVDGKRHSLSSLGIISPVVFIECVGVNNG